MPDRWWGSRAKETGLIQSALGASITGGVAILIRDQPLDANLVALGCQVAKGARRKVHLIYVIVVPRSLPLKAVLTQESTRADALLYAAMQIAERIGCEAEACIIQARAAGPAIVDEVRDRRFSLLLIGCTQKGSFSADGLEETSKYVLSASPCRIWLLQDPISPKS